MTKIINILKGTYAEFQKVTWPTKKQTIRLTVYVIGVSLLVGLFVAATDYLFRNLLGVVLN